MKKVLIVGLLAALTLLSGCAQDRTICGKTYEAYGLFNSEKRNPKVRYKPSVSGIIVAVIFFETVIVPIYIIGFDLFEPTDLAGNEPGVILPPTSCP